MMTKYWTDLALRAIRMLKKLSVEGVEAEANYQAAIETIRESLKD